MSWTKTPLMSCAAAIAFLASASVAAAGTIVVRSTGPSARAYAPGKSIPDNAKVALKTGDVVTILDGRGTRVLRGPGTFSTTAATATSTSINQVLKNTGARQVRTGAVRGVGGPTETSRPPNVWLVDATKSGTVCYAGTEPVSLWMPGQADAATVTLTRVSDGKSVPLALRPGQTIKVWPDELPVANGSEYRVARAGMSSAATVKFVALGPNPEGLESTAAALIRNGCNAQLDLLIETVAVPSSTEQPSG